MTFGRRKTQEIMATSGSKQARSFPLILPNGDSVDMEIFESCDYKISEYMKKYAFFNQNSSKICLNHLEPAEAKSLPFWNPKDEPAEKICTILSELITEIRKQYPHSVPADEMMSLRESDEIRTVLKETVSLRNVPLSLLQTTEESTSFLINLTNLMFLHALIFKSNDSPESFSSMDWTARQSYFSSVGYLVGKCGFVSLYDLHSVLLKYPMKSTSPIFSKLNFPSDARISFTIGQLFALSPKIEAIHPSHLDEYLQSCEQEYYAVCSKLNAVAPLSVPIPLFLRIEKAYYDNQLLPHTFQKQPIISEKLSLLGSHVGEITPEEMVQKGIFMVNDPQVTVNFSYSNLELNSFHRVSWKFCINHASFLHCCTDFMMTMKSYLLGKRYFEFPNKSIAELEQEIDILDVYKEIRSFTAQLMEEKFDSEDYPDEIRCLHNVLLFVVGEHESLLAGDNNPYEDIFKILRLSIKKNQEFSFSFAKIRICQKILISVPEIRRIYGNWLDLFMEQPCTVLSLLLDEQNSINLASEFVEAQFLFTPFYNFQSEAFAVYLSELCIDGETPSLKNNVLRLEENALVEIMNILVNKKCHMMKLKILVSCVLQHFDLSNIIKSKFYSLWMSLRMLAMLSEPEQYLFYNIVYRPDLIVEQIVMNRFPIIFKRIMSVTKNPFIVCPVTEELENEFREKVDEIILFYAEKALFFTKDLSLKDESGSPVKKFTPPKKIPSIEEWMPDEEAPTCTLCKRDFTVFTRRHHCRRCGRVVCHLCSGHKLEIFKFELKVRVCDDCYDYEKPLEIVVNDIVSPESLSETKIVWRLTGDSAADKKLRRQITYENGPDIIFCMALVEQHTPNNTLARFLSVKAEEMTKILRHRLIYSANFDYDQVAKCARSLTYAAKLLYSTFSDGHAVRRCEEMANEIELLKVCSQVSYVPQDPNKPMRDVEQWSVIKDRLTNLGQWKKALEIASKIGADTKSIWFLWGISLIKSGDWMSAREKFKYSSIKTNPSALKEILEAIHSSVEKGSKFEEGLHYIQLYGNKLSLYRYHIQCGKFDEAIDIAFENKISPELFADTVIFSYVKNNSWESLLKRMHELDPSHQFWKDHVRHSYKFLQNEANLDILYEFAKFTDDHYHLAVCLTKYFPRDSRSYKALKKKVNLLTEATENMDKLQEQPEEERVAKHVPKQQIHELIQEISTQIEINSIIWRDESLANQKYSHVPTIFNIKKTGEHLISLLIKAIDDVDRGFLFTIDLVNKYSLDCKACYSRATFGLGQQNRTSDIHRLSSLVVQWLSKNVKVKNNDTFVQVLDALFIDAVRGKPDKPMQFANRISDSVQKVEVLIETDQLKDALRCALQLEDPSEYLKRLNEIAKCRNLTWLKSIISQSLPETGDIDHGSSAQKK